ncbi:unnamed protein product [Rhodiola kirilowii]
MAGGNSNERTLEHTPTWAVAAVCFVLVVTSIVIEHLIHLAGKWLKKKHKKALFESLEKIKSELMLLGFISLLLTVGQGLISNICIPASAARSWHPCSKQEDRKNEESDSDEESNNRRRLLSAISSSGQSLRRILASDESGKCASKGKVPFISTEGLHQLHIFIFFLAVFHILYCILTMALGRLKMRKWKHWEKETRSLEYQITYDPKRFRFMRDTTFGRRHLSTWSETPLLIWIVCFVRQFVRSVPKVDYLTLRHGFILAHLAPESQTMFDFQRYINRSLEEDFKIVVGISPPIWFLAILFILFNTHGLYSYFWLPFIPFIVILVVGTKLQVIITRMGLRIQERGGQVIQGVPIVEPSDNLFWFNCPRLLIYLINFVLFQNAFQVAFFFWTWWEFGFQSCFHKHKEDIAIRIAMGLLIQFLCSYVTLPLYALVTQMGSSMKATVFDERVAFAIKKWHKSAKRNLKLKQSRKSSSLRTQTSSRPCTPTPTDGSLSPVHLLRHYRSEASDVLNALPCTSLPEPTENSNWEITDASGPPSRHFLDGEGSNAKHYGELQAYLEDEDRDRRAMVPVECAIIDVEISSKDFSFDKRAS